MFLRAVPDPQPAAGDPPAAKEKTGGGKGEKKKDEGKKIEMPLAESFP